VLKTVLKWIILIGAATASIGFLAVIISRLVTAYSAGPRIYSLADVPQERIAIVFGAGLRRDGSPSPLLRDRVSTAAELYFSGKVQKLLMSGSSDFRYHNEPQSMQEYALSLGVQAEDILMDESGSRTYATCYRAREIYQIERAILVTQGFHLPRALYLCNAFGIQSTGVPADLRPYRARSLAFWNLRESIATLVALWEVHVAPPLFATEHIKPAPIREAG
jgi:vancomycin permeability regulator SanA